MSLPCLRSSPQLQHRRTKKETCKPPLEAEGRAASGLNEMEAESGAFCWASQCLQIVELRTEDTVSQSSKEAFLLGSAVVPDT